MSRTIIIHSFVIYVLIDGVVFKLFIILSSIKITQIKNSLCFVGLISHHKNIINSSEEEEKHLIYSRWIINEVRLVEKHHKKSILSYFCEYSERLRMAIKHHKTWDILLIFTQKISIHDQSTNLKIKPIFPLRKVRAGIEILITAFAYIFNSFFFVESIVFWVNTKYLIHE